MGLSPNPLAWTPRKWQEPSIFLRGGLGVETAMGRPAGEEVDEVPSQPVSQG